MSNSICTTGKNCISETFRFDFTLDNVVCDCGIASGLFLLIVRASGILLVEDNDIDVELVARLTRRLGIDLPIVRAHNGLEALEILKHSAADLLKKPYIILLDINMPLMGGFELLDHLSNYGPKVKMPIYILSTSDARIDQSKAESYSVDGYLIKPLNKKSLTEVLIRRAA